MRGASNFVRFLSSVLAAPHGFVPFFVVRGGRRYVGVVDVGFQGRCGVSRNIDALIRAYVKVSLVASGYPDSNFATVSNVDPELGVAFAAPLRKAWGG